MEKKFNEATELRPQGNRAIDDAMVSIDLPSFIEKVKNEASWKNGDRNAITVFKTNGLRIVLIAMREGAEMARHTADGIISIQVLEGQIRFYTDCQSIELSKGQMLALHERIPHNVLAVKETFFLLTLTTTLAIKPVHA